MTPKIQPWALPLTQNQTAIWLDELLFEKSPMYNIGGYYEIKGPLEVALFGAALRRLVLEHDVFGLSIEYLEDGQACQHFTPQSDYRLPVLDFSNQEDASSRCVQWMNAHFQEAFDIMQGPLFSFTLLKAGGEHYYWLLKMHHLSVDGWGYSVLTNKVVAYYNELSGNPLDKLPVTFPYRDYVQEEQAYNSSAQFEKDKAYWLSKFESLPPLIREPQFARSVKDQLLPVSQKKWIIQRSEYAQLENLAKAQNVSVFQLWLGILATYFYRSTGQERLCIGVPVLNRSSKAHKNTIGLFTGVSPLMIDVNGQLTFSELLAQIRDTLRQDYRYQRFPIQELLRSLNHLTLGERSLFQLSFSYELSDMRLSLGDTTEQANLLTGDQSKTPFDLRLRDFANGGDVELDFYFLAAYFEETEVVRIIERLKAIVQDILIAADQPVSRINILPEDERALL